jgi:hypothetical protein
MPVRAVFIAIRIVGALLIAAAVIAQLVRSVTLWIDLGDVSLPLHVWHFFSFFTILSNLAAMGVLAAGAVRLIGRADDSRTFALWRVSATAYMAVTGLVYNTLLRGIELPQGTTVPWSNEILHLVAPLLVVVDWLLAPGRRPLEWRDLRVVLAFPIVWTVYTMVRGPFVRDDVRDLDRWYPYPFLDPALSANGYLSVAFYMVLIAVVFGLAGAGAIWVSRRRAGTRPADLPAGT